MSSLVSSTIQAIVTIEDQAVLTAAVSKGIRYQNALVGNENDKNCAVYALAKVSFKTVAQACLRNGVTVEGLERALSELDVTAEVQQTFFGNISAKLIRYHKKLGKSEDQSKATVEQFVEAAKKLKVAFDAVHEDAGSDAVYREFRIAKKGLDDDLTKHVGFYKFLKKNRPVIQKHEALLRVMCAEAGITHQKVSNKITNASVAKVQKAQ